MWSFNGAKRAKFASTYAAMADTFRNVNFYEIETSFGQGASLNKIHGKSGPKPSFDVYRNGTKLTEVPYSWPIDEAALCEIFSGHNDGKFAPARISTEKPNIARPLLTFEAPETFEEQLSYRSRSSRCLNGGSPLLQYCKSFIPSDNFILPQCLSIAGRAAK